MAQFYPWEIGKSFFCSSATEAVEGGILLSSLYTNRSEIIALQNGLHGRTKLGMSLTGLSFWRTDPNPVSGISHVPEPFCYKCPCGKNPDTCNVECAMLVKQTIETATSGKIASFIAEPIQGNGGIMVAPEKYFKRVHAIVKEAGGLFIVDETQTGMGRTGKKFAIEHYGVIPDIVCGGKALGGGTPIGYFSNNNEIASIYKRPGASTFGGNPVTAEAAIKFLEILQRDQLVEKSANFGKELGAMLNNLKSKFPDIIADVRGKGLMWGMELMDYQQQAKAVLTDNILEQAKDKGLLIGKTGSGRNVISLMPPLIVTMDQLKQAVDTLQEIFEKI